MSEDSTGTPNAPRDVTDPDVELTEDEIDALTDEQVSKRFALAARHVVGSGS